MRYIVPGTIQEHSLVIGDYLNSEYKLVRSSPCFANLFWSPGGVKIIAYSLALAQISRIDVFKIA